MTTVLRVAAGLWRIAVVIVGVCLVVAGIAAMLTTGLSFLGAAGVLGGGLMIALVVDRFLVRRSQRSPGGDPSPPSPPAQL